MPKDCQTFGFPILVEAFIKRKTNHLPTSYYTFLDCFLDDYKPFNYLFINMSCVPNKKNNNYIHLLIV